MRVTGMLLLMAVVLPAAGAAQEPARRPDAFFLERSQIFTRIPVDDLAFEGQIAPHLFFYRADPWGDGAVFRRPVRAGAVSFTPLLRLRMLSTLSHPVRTPSYMPRPFLDWQLFRASVVDTTWEDRKWWAVPIRVWAVTLTPWAHHSNGQDGCLFAHQTRDPVTEECVGTLNTAGVPPINRTDGSFSTNFIRVALGYSWFAPETVGDNLEAASRCTYQVGVEYHPLGYMMGALSEEQAAYYPQWQVALGAEWGAAFHGQWLVGLDARWLNDPAPDVGNWTYAAEVGYMPRFLAGWGAFIRYYDGMDYYNLGFTEEIRYVQLGMQWDLGAVPRFLFSDVTNMADPPPAYRQNRVLDRILPKPLDALCRALH